MGASVYIRIAIFFFLFGRSCPYTIEHLSPCVPLNSEYIPPYRVTAHPTIFRTNQQLTYVGVCLVILFPLPLTVLTNPSFQVDNLFNFQKKATS